MYVYFKISEKQIMSINVYYIEDEPNLGKIVKETLEKQGFKVLWESDGAKVMDHLSTFQADICVLDIMLPNVDGYTLCAWIRDQFPVLPIIFLTAKVETADLIKGFDAGGTDYMRKPFSIEELIVRINNQLHLHNGKKSSPELQNNEINIGEYIYYPNRYELQGPSGLIKLSQREQEVMHVFAAYKNQVIDRKKLLLNVWGDDSFFNSRNLDVYIKKLRNHFKEDTNIQIQTLKGKGYLFLTGSEN